MKKGIALVLAFIFVFSAFLSIKDHGIYGAVYTEAADKCESQVVEKIDKLVELLDGKYFTTTGKSCGNSACTKCYNANVFEAEWFHEMFGEVSYGQIPGHAYPGGGSGYPRGWSCHGFANFAMWYVFSTTNSDIVTYDRVVDDVAFTQSNIEKYAKPGDIIRYETAYSGHSAMIIDADETGITVIDCNARAYPDGYCCVRKHRISYNNRDMAISRASNYVDTPTLKVNYNSNGGEILNSELQGYRYKVESDNGLNVRSGPGTSYGVVGVLSYGAEFEVSKDEIVYGNGYYWGKTTVGSKTGWTVVSKFVSKIADIWGSDYYIEDSLIFDSKASEAVGDKMEFGVEYKNGLADPEKMGLAKEGYYFKGWSLDPDGTNVIEPSKPIYPESIVANIESGSLEVTLYAIWQWAHEHSMSGWVDNGDTHVRKCECGEAEYAEHVWSFVSATSEYDLIYQCMDCNSIQSSKIENGLYTVDGVLYYFQNGEKVSGFFEYNEKTYYADKESFEVVNYNKKIDGVFYIWNNSVGLQIANGFVETEEGTLCYENGRQVIGWRHADGSGPRVVNGVYEQYSQNPQGLYYFLSTTGYMVTEESYVLGGYTRQFNADHTVKALDGLQTKAGLLYYYENGVIQTGWHVINGETYYFLASDDVYGQAATKWVYIGNKIYYFYATSSEKPYALKSSGSIGGIDYTYGEDGRILYTGFVNCEYANEVNNNSAGNIQKKNSTTRYYINGEMQTGWQYIDGCYYYFYAEGSANGSGYMCTESRYIGGVWYAFTSSGICLNK